MKIRITESLGPMWKEKIGDVLKVFEDPYSDRDGNYPCVTLYRLTTGTPTEVGLIEIKGHYEEVEELPEEGTPFFYISLNNNIVADMHYAHYYQDIEYYTRCFKNGNFFLRDEKEEAQKICDSINAMFEKRKGTVK